MPTPKELKSELDGKIIDVRTNSFAMWHTKRYKVLGYNPETDLYTCAATKVDGPLEHIKLKAENITVYVDVIPVEESSEDETSKSEDEDDDDDDEEDVSVPFTLDGLKKMSRDKLRQECFKYNLATGKVSDCKWTKKDCIEALAEKFGLEGSTLTDQQQKIEETNQAMAAFLLLPVVVAIISKIRGFDPKNKAHAQSFMNEYKEQNGKGTTRS